MGKCSLSQLGQRKPGKGRQAGLFLEVSPGCHKASLFVKQT